MYGSILSLCKLAKEKWHDHPFSQRSRTTEKGGGGGGRPKFETGVVGNIEGGGLQKIRGLAAVYQLCM